MMVSNDRPWLTRPTATASLWWHYCHRIGQPMELRHHGTFVCSELVVCSKAKSPPQAIFSSVGLVLVTLIPETYL